VFLEQRIVFVPGGLCCSIFFSLCAVNKRTLLFNKRQEKHSVAFLTLDNLSTTGIHYSPSFAVTLFQIHCVRCCPVLDAKLTVTRCENIVVHLGLQHFEVPHRYLFSHSRHGRSRAEQPTSVGTVCGRGRHGRSEASPAAGGGRGRCALGPAASWSCARAPVAVNCTADA